MSVAIERFVVVSRNVARAERAAALGLPTATLDEVERDGLEEWLGGAPACVLECAGTAAAARLAVDVVGPLGRVVLVGIALDPLDLSAPALVLKEAEIRGALAYRRADFAEAIALLAAGRIPVHDLVTASAGLDQAEAMFQLLTGRRNTHVKVAAPALKDGCRPRAGLLSSGWRAMRQLSSRRLSGAGSAPPPDGRARLSSSADRGPGTFAPGSCG